MTLNCLIVDDEPLAQRVLEKYLEELAPFKWVGSCSNPFQALEIVDKQRIDVLFLDINMPKLSGFGLLKSLQNPPLVIITTAYPEFAVESFELEVLDYLLKPISIERFLKAANKALQQKKVEEKLALVEEEVSNFLSIRADRKLYQIKTSSIRYLQAYGDYVKVFTKEGMLLPKETLNQIQQRLPATAFIRVHRSFLVARSSIHYLEGNFLYLGEEKIPVGASYRQEVLKKLKLF